MDIISWLKSKGYNCAWNVELGPKVPDLIAFNDNEIMAFEIKGRANEVSNAVGQCLHYLTVANKAYVALSSEEAKKVRRSSVEILKKHGIGLISINDKISIILDAKSFPNANKSIIKILNEKNFSNADTGENQKEILKNKILDILEEHLEGLTIQDLSKIIKVHRQTITKYILALEALGMIYRRRIGAVTLHYLKENWERLKK